MTEATRRTAVPDETVTIKAEELAAANRDLALRVVELLGSEEQFELYADDIVMEFPYGPSLGMPDRFETKPNVVAYVGRILEGLAGVLIREVSLSSVAGDPTTVFVEYDADCPTPGGNTYRQIYINKMQFRDGKLLHMRELWDPKKMIDAGNGVFDEQGGN
jgi:ketosteroid isomerase-like protein